MQRRRGGTLTGAAEQSQVLQNRSQPASIWVRLAARQSSARRPRPHHGMRADVVFSGGDVPYADDGFVGRVPMAGGPIQWLALLLTETPFVPLAGPTPSFNDSRKLVKSEFPLFQNIPC